MVKRDHCEAARQNNWIQSFGDNIKADVGMKMSDQYHYYLVIFSHDDDYSVALMDGPWLIYM